MTSSLRYTNKSERDRLQQMQSSLDRSDAVCAALIPIKKSDAWWSLAQDERRAIIEERSSHFQIGMDYCQLWRGNSITAAIRRIL